MRANSENSILLVANYGSDVGYAWWLMENYWIEIAKHFSKRKKNIFLIYPRINTIPLNIQNESINILRHDFTSKSREALGELKKIVKTNKIKNVYLTDRNYYDYRYYLLRKWGVKRIVLHDHTPGERPGAILWKKIIKRGIYQIPWISCDLYIGVSRFVYDRFINNGCIPPKKCTYVLNGIKPINIEDKNKFLVHDEFKIKHDAVIIVSTGRASFYKGIDFILKCAAKLIHEEKDKNIYFLHCGDGPDLNSFKQLANELKISNRTIFAGNRSNVRELLQSCDIAMHASKGEAFSLSILEYMSAGLATIAPCHCGNSEAITNNTTGYLYEPNNVQNAVMILKKLIKDKGLRKIIGTNAIKKVREKHDIKDANKQFMECMDNVII